MGRPSRYSSEVRERAVRMVLEHQGEYDSQWGAMTLALRRCLKARMAYATCPQDSTTS